MRILVIAGALATMGGCANGGAEVSPARAEAVRVEVEQALRDAYDLSRPDVVRRMMALYPRSGRIVSANSGRTITSRDSLEAAIRYFWDNVGVNMREPRWQWDTVFVDVLSPTSAAVTATYRILHRNPRNEPHVLGGAMTVVFQQRGGRWVVVQEHLSDLPQVPDSIQANTATHDDH